MIGNGQEEGFKSGFAAARKGAMHGAAIAETDRDLPMKWMLVSLAVLFAVAHVTDDQTRRLAAKRVSGWFAPRMRRLRAKVSIWICRAC